MNDINKTPFSWNLHCGGGGEITYNIRSANANKKSDGGQKIQGGVC